MKYRACALAVVLAPLALAANARAQGETPTEGARRVTKMPKLTRFVEAEYPPERRARGETADVTLTIEIAADGTVRNVAVAEGAGADFDEAAIAAARAFVFEPAEVNGKPIAAKITYRYSFVLKTEPVVAPSTGTIRGVVRDRKTGDPRSGVVVRLTDTGAATTTLDDGSFVLADVPAGEHPIEIRAPGLEPTRVKETVLAGKELEVKYTLEEAAPAPSTGPPPEVEEVTVHGTRVRREITQVSIRREQGRLVPGTQGDTLKVVENLPGVARASFGSGQLVVWGSTPRETRVFVDGVEIPALYHLGGIRGAINGELVNGVDFVPGAYGAEYGRGLGGLVRIETRALPSEGVHGYVGADALDASAMVAGAVRPGVRAAAAVRQSYVDRLLQGVVSPDVGDFFPIPRYRDYQLKTTIGDKPEELHVVAIGSDDRLTRTVPSTDPKLRRSERTHATFHRVYAVYARDGDGGAQVRVTPFVGYDTTDVSTTFGDVPTRLETRSLRYGVRASHRSRATSALSVVVGVDALGSATSLTRAGSINRPPREGDIYAFGLPPGDDVNQDGWNTHLVEAAPHAIADLELGRLTLTAGARFTTLMIEGSRQTPRVGATPAIGFTRLEGALEPRLGARLAVTPRVAMTAAAGRFHQAPEPEDLSAVFGTPDLGYARADHLTVGAAAQLTKTTSLELMGFYKTLADLPFRSRLPTPRLAVALVQDGEGRSFGGQTLLRQELWKGFFGWISYTLSRSERRYVGDPEWRLFDYDQPHVLAVIASQQVGPWTFGARFRYASGAPRTPVVATYYDPRGDRYLPVFGDQNSIRLPDFYQFDARVERRFALGGSVKLDIYVDVQNVTARRNGEEFVYTSDFRQRGTVAGLPTLAIAGARVTF